MWLDHVVAQGAELRILECQLFRRDIYVRSLWLGPRSRS